MKENVHLYILWTNADMITAEKMVFMYGVNSLLQGWWKEVTIIIWGAPARLVTEHISLQDKIRDAINAGVNITACKACADQLGVTEELERMNIEVKYWGKPLTQILKNQDALLTI